MENSPQRLPFRRLTIVVAIVTFSIPSFSALPPDTPCGRYLALMRPAPVLIDELGRPIDVSEGDWKPFLDRQIVLSDGTRFAYRDFDRLGPEFWKHYSADWEAVARQIFEDLSSELERRGHGTSRHYWDLTKWLNRYIVGINASPGSALHAINERLRAGDDRPLEFNPSHQMGIVKIPSPFDIAHPISHLPLSWLGMEACHACAYVDTLQRAKTAADDLVIHSAYLAGDTGRRQIGPMVAEGGEFRNEWASRQQRRGPRALRVERARFEPDSSGGQEPSTIAQQIEFTLAEEIKILTKKLRDKPQSLKRHKDLAIKLGEYLQKTGIPISAVKAPDGNSYDIRVLPQTVEQWHQAMKIYTTDFGKGEVPGSDAPPEVVEISRLAHERGYDAVFNTASLLSFDSGIDPRHSRLVLFPTGLFSKVPLERRLQGDEMTAVLPAGEPRIVAAAVPMISTGTGTDGFTGDAASYRANVQIAHQLIEEIKQLNELQAFLDPAQYSDVLRFKLATLRVQADRVKSAHTVLTDVIQADPPLKATDLRLRGRKGTLLFLEARVPTRHNPVSMVLDLPTAGADKAEIKRRVLKLFADESVRVVAHGDEVVAINEFLFANNERLSTRNEFSEEQVKGFVRQHDEQIEATKALLKRIRPADYFQRLQRNSDYWKRAIKNRRIFALSDDAPIADFMARAATLIKNDAKEFHALLAVMKPYFLQAKADFTVRDQFRTIIRPSIEKYSGELISFATELLEHSAGDEGKTVAIELLNECGARDKKTFALLKKEIAREVPWNEYAPRNAVYAMELFPKALDETVVPLIRSNDPKKRAAALSVITDAKHYSEPALVAAAEGLYLESSAGNGSTFLTNSATQNPKVIAILKRHFAERAVSEDRLVIVAEVLKKLKVYDRQFQAPLHQYLKKYPDQAAYYGFAELLFGIDVNDPIARQVFALRVQEHLDKGNLSVEDFAGELRKLHKSDPNHPLLAQAFQRLTEMIKIDEL